LHGDAAATPQALPAPAAPPPSRIWQNPFAKRAGIFATIAAVCTAAIGVGAALLPGRAIAPIARPDASVYSATTIARGQQLAALGNCAECHTTIGGAVNAGGRALETPFGTIYATTSRPISKPASAPGPIPLSSARCATGFIAMGGSSIPSSRTRIFRRRARPIFRRSMPT